MWMAALKGVGLPKRVGRGCNFGISGKFLSKSLYRSWKASGGGEVVVFFVMEGAP